MNQALNCLVFTNLGGGGMKNLGLVGVGVGYRNTPLVILE